MDLNTFIDGLRANRVRAILAECAADTYIPLLAQDSDTNRDRQLKILLDFFVIRSYISQFCVGTPDNRYLNRINELIDLKMKQNNFRFTALRISDEVRQPFVYITSKVIGGVIYQDYPESLLFSTFKDCFEVDEES